jgi:hypothetical protein
MICGRYIELHGNCKTKKGAVPTHQCQPTILPFCPWRSVFDFPMKNGQKLWRVNSPWGGRSYDEYPLVNIQKAMENGP